ncbi:MAG: DMT family transporter, partial [Actinomycetota bacterium]
RRGEAAVVAARIFAVPIVGAALGVVLLGEPLTIGLVIGGLGVAAGIRLVNETERPGARASPAALPGDSLDG